MSQQFITQFLQYLNDEKEIGGKTIFKNVYKAFYNAVCCGHVFT